MISKVCHVMRGLQCSTHSSETQTFSFEKSSEFLNFLSAQNFLPPEESSLSFRGWDLGHFSHNFFGNKFLFQHRIEIQSNSESSKIYNRRVVHLARCPKRWLFFFNVSVSVSTTLLGLIAPKGLDTNGALGPMLGVHPLQLTDHNTGISLLLSTSAWALLSPPIERRETRPTA